MSADCARPAGQGGLDRFELPDPSDRYRTSAELAVKKSERGEFELRRENEVRTRGALARTMAHLFGLLRRNRDQAVLIHAVNFLFDRLRAVRRDIKTQASERPAPSCLPS